MSLTFYHSPHSSASPVHWTLEELGIPYEKISLNLQSGEHKRPDYLKLNPNGRVPLLVHNGVPIFESAAIQMYLGEQFGVEKGLYPPPGTQRGEVMKWIVWTNATLAEAMSRYGRNVGDWAKEDERNAKAGATAKADVEECLRIIDETLVGKDYLAGSKFSLADVHLASWMDYVRMMNFDLNRYSALTAWLARCSSRPAYARAA